MKTRLRSNDGATIAELSLLLPVFVLVVLGIVQGGMFLRSWVALSNTTREVARYTLAGVRDGDSASALVSALRPAITNGAGALPGAAATVNVTASDGTTGSFSLGAGADSVTLDVTVASDGVEASAVQVVARYTMPLLVPIPYPAGATTLPISVSSTMRAE